MISCDDNINCHNCKFNFIIDNYEKENEYLPEFDCSCITILEYFKLKDFLENIGILDQEVEVPVNDLTKRRKRIFKKPN